MKLPREIRFEIPNSFVFKVDKKMPFRTLSSYIASNIRTAVIIHLMDAGVPRHILEISVMRMQTVTNSKKKHKNLYGADKKYTKTFLQIGTLFEEWITEVL